jgi:hypothetical protein
MRIALPEEVISIKPYVKPEPVVPLSPEVSKALIASGVFAHSLNKVLWTAPGEAASRLGKPLELAASVELGGGIRFQPRLIPQQDDSLLATLLEVGKQSAPFLEQAGLDGVADGAALLVATPDIFHALTKRGPGKAEKIFLYAVNLLRFLKIVNQVAHVPHADAPLEVVATIFKVGEQVFISGVKESG